VQSAVTIEGPVTFSNVNPADGSLYTNACTVTMAAQVVFPGSINAPYADVTMNDGSAISGCLWAKSAVIGPRTPSPLGSTNLFCTLHNDGSQTTVSCSDNTTVFTYDGEGKRVAKANPLTRTFYAGDLYERVTDNNSGNVTHKYHVYSPAGLVAISTRVRTKAGVTVGTDSVNYVLTDHLGSADVLVDSTGKTVERRSYDPFGKRRSIPGSGIPLSNVTDPSLAGFTDHEDDVDLSLVNMSGRMYDPVLARFLCADPLVSNPADGQAWNRYSYGFNNPLSGSDPSGFDWNYDVDEDGVLVEVSPWQYDNGGHTRVEIPVEYGGGTVFLVAAGSADEVGGSAESAAPAAPVASGNGEGGGTGDKGGGPGVLYPKSQHQRNEVEPLRHATSRSGDPRFTRPALRIAGATTPDSSSFQGRVHGHSAHTSGRTRDGTG
jgi:RHS repeat-associated protein